MENEITEALMEPLKQTFEPGSTRLLSIKVDNFRSYEHAEIGPFADLTMVVGPNGAGKSNMVQAVLWATGASVDNNVARRGQGQDKQEVKVSLVFGKKLESGEVEETEFTRVMNVSGRNQYMMNQTVTTKKLFLLSLTKLGICGKKAISCVVQQMTVEKLALLTGKSLTTVIEEISGSIQHKNAYEELSQKLSKVEEKFQTVKRKNAFACERLRDSSAIVRKLQDQLAESQEFGKTLADMKQALAYMKLWKLDAEMRGHVVAKESILQKQTEVSVKQAELLRLKQQQPVDSREKNSEIQQNLEEVLAEICVHDDTVQSKKRQLIEKTLELKNLESMTTKFQKLVQRDEEKMDQLKESLNKLHSERQQKLLKLQELQQAAQTSSLEWSCPEEVFCEFWSLKMKSESELKDQLLQVSELEDDLKQLEDQRTLLALQKDTKQIRMDITTSEIDKLLRDQQIVESDILNLEDEEKSLSVEIESLKGLQSTIYDLEQRIKKLKDDIEASDESRLAKRQLNAVLAALKQKFGESIHGILADMWEPTAEKYRTPALALLYEWQNCIVVDSERTVYSCLAVIQKDFAGVPVKIIPLDQFPALAVEELNRPSPSSDVYLLLDRLVIDSVTRGIFHHLLENTVVCSNKQEALKYAWKTEARRNAVDISSGLLFTTRGTVVARVNSPVEGSLQTSDHQKQTELIELQRQLDVAVAELREKDQTVIDDNCKLLLDLKLELKHKDKKRLNQSMKEAQSNLKTDRLELDKINEEEQNCTLEIRRVASALQHHRSAIISSECRTFDGFRQIHGEETLVKMQQKTSYFRKSSLDAQNETTKQDLIGAVNELEQKVTQARDDLNTAEISKNLWQTEVSKITEELARVQLDRETLKLQMSECEQKATSLKDTKSNIEKMLKESDNTRVPKQLRKLQEQLRILKKSLNAETLHFFRKRDMKAKVLRECLEEEISVRVKIQDEEDNIYDKALQPEDLNQDDIIVHYTEETVTSTFRESQTQWDDIINEMKDNIKSQQNSVGNRLEESLNRAQEKHDRLQHEATNASEAFQNARKELAETSREFKAVEFQRENLFRSCFDKLQELIGRIYKRLYAGQPADAALCAINDESPFLDAIDYSCLVPGKQLCKMEQLSGGEKTIAALTLLFAVLNFQSPAFLILDEVDAALDHNKLSMLRDFLKNGSSGSSDVSLPSPCIVVTHQRNMMYGAQALIGISRVPGDTRSTLPVSLNLDMYKENEG